MSRDWPICNERILVSVNVLGFKVRVNKEIALAVRAAAHLAARTTTGKRILAAKGKGALVQGYNCRQARSSDSHSEHSHGTALDVDPANNPFTKTDGRHRPRLVTNLDASFINCFKKMGFRWGGDWTTDLGATAKVLAFNGKQNPYCRRVCDAMHFEFALTPAQAKAKADYYRRVLAS